MKISVQKNNLGGQIWYRNLDLAKNNIKTGQILYKSPTVPKNGVFCREFLPCFSVSWSVRAAPTIKYVPCSLIPFAVRRLIEVAREKSPIQIYFIINDLVRDPNPWFIELIAYLINSTNIKFSRPVIVNLVDADETKELAELAGAELENLGLKI